MRKEIIQLLNKALEMEHQANVQYLSHAELVDGINSEPIIERLKEIASDEAKHAAKYRELIGDYLDGTPSMGIAKTTEAKDIKGILIANLKGEMEAVEYYGAILENIGENKPSLPYTFLRLEHDVRHILMEEEEHISELRKLLAMKIGEVEGKKF
ncbi:MAG: ferritin-like domain-containing protein [Candidatus Altiarchaeota archaeon]